MKEFIEKLKEKLKSISGVYKDQNNKLYYLIDPTNPLNTDYYRIRVDGTVELTCLSLEEPGEIYVIYNLIEDKFDFSTKYSPRQPISSLEKTLESDNYLKINKLYRITLGAYINSLKDKNQEADVDIKDHFLKEVNNLITYIKSDCEIFRLDYECLERYDSIAIRDSKEPTKNDKYQYLKVTKSFSITQEDFNGIVKIINKFYENCRGIFQ
jgi:hypothetical protein